MRQRFKSERYNVFIEEVNKTALSLNDDARIQSIQSIKNICIWNKQISTK